MKVELKYVNSKKTLKIIPENAMERMALESWYAEYEEILSKPGYVIERAADFIIEGWREPIELAPH